MQEFLLLFSLSVRADTLQPHGLCQASLSLAISWSFYKALGFTKDSRLAKPATQGHQHQVLGWN